MFILPNSSKGTHHSAGFLGTWGTGYWAIVRDLITNFLFRKGNDKISSTDLKTVPEMSCTNEYSRNVFLRKPTSYDVTDFSIANYVEQQYHRPSMRLTQMIANMYIDRSAIKFSRRIGGIVYNALWEICKYHADISSRIFSMKTWSPRYYSIGRTNWKRDKLIHNLWSNYCFLSRFAKYR